MASASAGFDVQKEKVSSRKRKRAEISGFSSTAPSTLAATSQAPRGINAAQFAEARALEINNMVEAIKEADSLSGKRLFQTLPRHMRRRAMSHNVKRMPARLRNRASLEMHAKVNKPADLAKNRSRRYRRKPKNLLEEYTRRQREHVWLETHIWHAKRMKMIDAWGYRLADHPNDKGFRAAYRAVKNNCILQDISYYGCIEVSGVQEKIIQALTHLTSQEAGLTIGARCYLSGSRQGHAMLYKFDQYPHGAIGPVSFLWRQGTKLDTTAVTKDAQKSGLEKQNVENSDTDLKLTTDCEIPEKETNISQLWIWSHPASFLSVFDAIAEACNSVGRTSVERDSKFPENVKTHCVEKTQQSDQQKSVHSPLLNGIEHSVLRISSRRFDLLQFRLTGPQSHALLAKTLTLCSNSKHKDFSDQIDKKESTFRNDKSIDISPKWWQKSIDSSSDLSSQNVLWGRLKQASSPSVLPAGCVIGLTVLDPRLDLPVKKISTATGAEGINAEESVSCDEDEVVSKVKVKDKKPSFEHLLSHWPTDVAGSYIWDETVRREVKETKIPEQEFNRKRSELLVPGSQLDLSEEEISHIPLLLIQQPGCLDNRRETSVGVGYGSSWDIVLPSGWAMAFWMALVYRGARTGGLQEGETLALEQGVPFFPNDFPDTPAGESYNAKLKDDGEAKYKRYPPAKRPNYDRLGVKSPFSPPWRELVKDWSCCKEVSSSAADGPTKSPSESTRTKIIASDSPQMDVSVVQPPHVSSTMKDKVGKISSDSRQHTQTNAIANCSSPMVGSVVQTLSVPDGTKEALTENTSDSSKPNAISNESAKMVGSVVQTLSVQDGAKEALTENTIDSSKPNAISNESAKMVGSVVQTLSVPDVAKDATTESTGDYSNTNAIASETAQRVSSVVQSFYILRSRSKLSTLRSFAARCKQRQTGGSKQRKKRSQPLVPLVDFDLSSIVKSDPNSLVCVLLRMVNRSVPVPISAVAIPSTEDTTRLGKCRDFSGPLEPLHKGPQAQLAAKSLRNSCAREIFGFVSSGHYSLSRGCGFGVAFCALPGLVKLLSCASDTGEPVVLVRGPSTQQYRFAHLTIL